MNEVIDVGKRDAGRRTLAEVMTMNEEIKRVIGISREVDMAALNAILMARRADGGGAGFRVVSAEMRTFGSRLGQDMALLGALIHDLTGRAAELRRRERRLGLFEQLSSRGADSRLAAILDRMREDLARAQAGIDADKSELAHRLVRARRLCDMGRALSRNAAVEATYAGAMAPVLAQVSRHAATAVDEVLLILSAMQTRMEIRA